MKREKSKAEILLWDHLGELRGVNIWKERSFWVGRKWRFDFAVSDPLKVRIAIEIEGGIWVKGGGGHNRGKAFMDDMEKYNHAALSGWKVLRFTPKQVLDGTAIAFIKQVLES